MTAESTVISRSVLDKAAAWLARRDKGFSPVEQSQFEAWRSDRPEHAAAIARLEGSWGLMDRPLQSGSADEVLRGLATKARRRGQRRAGAAFATVLTLMVAGSFWNSPPQSETPPKSNVAVLVPARQILPDGTVVDLKDSASIAVEFTAAQRRVTLNQGLAHFQVTKDPSRPFTVAASGIEVRAVGTAFTVDHQAQRVEVLVTEGLVAVVPTQPASSMRVSAADDSKPDILVTVGEIVALAVKSRQVIVPVNTVAPAELAERVAWRVPRLEFTGTPLAEAVRLMNQHNRVKFIIEDPLLAQEQVSGLFRADRADGFIQALETGFGIAAERRGENEIVLRRTR